MPPAAGACAKHSPLPVTFFARKGADCLGKFHGEAERTLRLLFEEVGSGAGSRAALPEVAHRRSAAGHAGRLELAALQPGNACSPPGASILDWALRRSMHAARSEWRASSAPICGAPQASRRAPAIIFLDELDALVPARAARAGGSDQIYASGRGAVGVDCLPQPAALLPLEPLEPQAARSAAVACELPNICPTRVHLALILKPPSPPPPLQWCPRCCPSWMA